MLSTGEKERLAAVRRYEILDTPSDGTFDRITLLATQLFDVPISIVSIVDEDRIWFKSAYGVDVQEIDRAPGLCASAILQDAPWIVTDARVDPRTLTNSLVVGELGLRFYAGVPLTTFDGHNLGTLNIIDVEPREMTDTEMVALRSLAAIVVDELELRLAARQAFARARRDTKRALRFNDSVVRALAAAGEAMDGGDPMKCSSAVEKAMMAAQKAVVELFADASSEVDGSSVVKHVAERT